MAADTKGTAHETLEERLLHRLLFFTDAVFAIVLTLMVLDLHPPPFASPLGDAHAMRGMASRLFALALSFAVIAIFWLAHLNSTRRLLRFDWPTAFVNLLFLFPICLLPFATAWYGQSFQAPFPWGMYCATLVVISTLNVALVLVVSRGGGRLIGGASGREVLYRAARAASPGLAFAAGLGLLFAHQLYISEFCWVLIGPISLAVERTLKPRGEPQAQAA
ncbi:MAG: TMEM175 family protein [Phenylobacterium sp.]